LPDDKLSKAPCFNINKFAPGAYQVRCEINVKGVGVISEFAASGSAESGSNVANVQERAALLAFDTWAAENTF
jgi:hypothetical protein